MKMQQKVILSLGSNQGNRLEHIENCIQQIHQKIGLILHISNLYETPSWGFSSDSFYNCALVLHTSFTAEKILQKIASIEKKLGRIKQNTNDYQARIIDIDIIAIDEQIYSSETLNIPHKEMQNRLFVLLPMLDLKLEWQHPILKKPVQKLIAICNDKSDCKWVCNLDSVLRKYSISQFNYIVIEGNIGAGKTTLTSKIAEDFFAKSVLERFADNPFLLKFYKDQNKYAFPLEMQFLADRYQQLFDDLSQLDLSKDLVIADYHIYKSLIFAKVTLQEDEFKLYKNLFDIIIKEMPKPDLYVYLYQNTDQLLQHIKNRGRSYEQEIEAEYLEKINHSYLDYIKSQTDLNILIIDVSGSNFVEKQEDYVTILDAIQEKLEI